MEDGAIVFSPKKECGYRFWWRCTPHRYDNQHLIKRPSEPGAPGKNRVPQKKIQRSISKIQWTSKGRFGSVGVVQANSSPMTALERIPGPPGQIFSEVARMSALTNTGRSKVFKLPKLDGSYRPEADAWRPLVMAALRGLGDCRSEELYFYR